MRLTAVVFQHFPEDTGIMKHYLRILPQVVIGGVPLNLMILWHGIGLFSEAVPAFTVAMAVNLTHFRCGA